MYRFDGWFWCSWHDRDISLNLFADTKNCNLFFVVLVLGELAVFCGSAGGRSRFCLCFVDCVLVMLSVSECFNVCFAVLCVGVWGSVFLPAVIACGQILVLSFFFCLRADDIIIAAGQTHEKAFAGRPLGVGLPTKSLLA